MTHRSEISELNKLAADIAIREQTDSNPSEVDLSNIPDLPCLLYTSDAADE